MNYINKGPWKLTISRSTKSWQQSKSSDNTETSYFALDKRYKSYVRWEHKLTNGSSIENLVVERSNKYDIKTGDSFTVVLKIQGVAEKTMGTIDCTTPVIQYNPKQWLSNITRSSTYVRVYLYERASGLSASNVYQAAADNYNIFMSELREIWRKELVDILIKEEIIEKKALNEYSSLEMEPFYQICKRLFRKCKSNQVWGDFQDAFDSSFGPINDNHNNNNNNNHNMNRNVNMNMNMNMNMNTNMNIKCFAIYLPHIQLKTHNNIATPPNDNQHVDHTR